MVKITIDYIVRNSIDVHFHIGPEVIQRKYESSIDLVKNLQGKMKGLVLKNHFYSTAQLAFQVRKTNLRIVPSVTLNKAVGGLNPDAIFAVSLLSDRPFFVWFPTIDAQCFLNSSKYRIPLEWTKGKNVNKNSEKNFEGIKVINDRGQLTKDTLLVLDEIKKCNAVLATGHISAEESSILLQEACKRGLKKMIITHPIYQKINMDVKEQKNLAKSTGCFIEICYSMYSIDNISISKIASQIKEIGSEHIILSSDVGQYFSPNPDIALKNFAELLMEEGISKEQLYEMMVKNPGILLS